MCTVPFLKDISLRSSSNFDSSSKRFKYYLEQASKEICRFLNPGFELGGDSQFQKAIVIPEGFASMDPNKEGQQIYTIDLFTVEGIYYFLCYLLC
jgi:hypothetical protein